MKTEHIIIKSALDEFISKTINVCYEIIGYPDETETNQPACDVRARAGCRDVAIEHTSIDSVPSQREDDDRFMKVLYPLESELAGKLPTPGHYQLLIHMNAIPTGINWENVRLQILKWCQKVAPNLEIGDTGTAPRHFVREVLQGVPFEVTLYRFPGQDGQFKTMRFSPTDADLENQREEVIYKALVSRGKKVAEYGKKGFRTMLVLESKDIALANSSVIGQAFINATKRVGSVQLPDEVYLVETYEAKPYHYKCLKFGDTMFPYAKISEEPYVSHNKA